MSERRITPVIAIIGVCGAGKTTLVSRLKERGIECRHVAQEHSYVKDMWQRLVDPDFLVFLEVSYISTVSRRKLNWTRQEYEEQYRRVSHAREHADLLIDTDRYSIDDEIELIMKGLTSAGLVMPDHGQNPGE